MLQKIKCVFYLRVSVSEFLQRYQSHADYDPALFDQYRFVLGQAYDHIWMTAIALNCAVAELKRVGGYNHNFVHESLTIP